MKKFFITALCISLVVTIGSGAFPKRAEAGPVISAIVAFVAAPITLFDPLTALIIVDAFTCEVNVIWGCDSNGDPLPEPTPVVTLTVPATIELPNPVTLDWTANARAVSCTASGEWSGNKALVSGSETVISPTGIASLGAHSYTLSCVNSEGTAGTATASTNVIGPSVSLTATSGIIEVPDPVSLSWVSQNTVSCTASGDWNGNKAVSGSETVIAPTNVASRGLHTYNLTCVNGSNYPATSLTTVRVNQVPKCTIGSNPAVITPPQSSQLTWACDYASSCSINRGIGAVNPVAGSRTVMPSATATYTLTCAGFDGSRDFQTTVGVGGTGGVPLPSGATTSPRIIETRP